VTAGQLARIVADRLRAVPVLPRVTTWVCCADFLDQPARPLGKVWLTTRAVAFLISPAA